ncbi:MAG: hypothetical protein IJ391_01610, partial [Clostridia bacterium]|nr:hypothetical protein [Clostridia bacterium]
MKAKILITALLLFCTLFALTTAISADYTTDGDDATTVDYLIIEADDIKLATGTNGTVTYDELGHKVARYKPSETYISPEGGMTYVTPANAGAGYAATGENSLFDFPYTVLYYRTSDTAATTGNLMLTGNSTFKWNGGAHIKKSTEYTGIIIDRDSYTKCNHAATTPYEKTSTNHGFTLKTFPTADVEGYLDIAAVASFRTKAQAEDFIANYSMDVYSYKTDNDDSTETDYIIMNADDIKLATGTKGTVTYDELGHKIAQYQPSETYVSPEGGWVTITPANANAGYAASGTDSFFDFPYTVLYYRTSSSAASTGNLMLTGNSTFKWNGGAHIKRQTSYGGIIIDRDSYTTGNPAATTPYDNTAT